MNAAKLPVRALILFFQFGNDGIIRAFQKHAPHWYVLINAGLLKCESSRQRFPGSPHALCRDGFVYVADRQADRVLIFTKQGKFVKEFTVAPETLDCDSGKRVQRFLVRR